MLFRSNGMATAADWMSAASFISMAGLISFMGRDGSVYLMGWTGGYVLLALLLAPYLRKFGKFTVPDFIGDRYYSQTARLVAVVCAIFVSFTYVAGQMRGVGIVFSRFLEVEINTGVMIGMAIVFFYAVVGGMKGIIYFKFVNPTDNNADHWLWGISPEGIGTLGMCLNFLVSGIIATFTPPPPADVVEMIENIRVPNSKKA